jgi:putative ABC transport system permease protein
MNVMFVSVKERTAEIGILKAVGCSKRSILLEFLLEASFISVLGGVLGVGIGLALMPLLDLFGIRAERSLPGLLLAMTFAVATGTVFGFYPAWKASKLVPIQALDLK